MHRDDPYRNATAFRDAAHLNMLDLGLGQASHNAGFSSADVQQALHAARAATSAAGGGGGSSGLTQAHSLGNASAGSWITPPTSPGIGQYSRPGHYSPYSAPGSGGRKSVMVGHRSGACQALFGFKTHPRLP